MHQHGFAYALPPRTTQDFLPYYRTADQLAASGYHPNVLQPGKAPNDLILATLNADDRQRWYKTLFGDQQGQSNSISMKALDGSVESVSMQGCDNEARAKIYGSLQGYLSYTIITGVLSGEASRNQLWADSRYQTVAATWRACMKQQGLQVDQHEVYGGDMVQAAFTNHRPNAVSYERQVLSADIACMRKTGIDQLRADTLARISRDTAQRQQLNVAGAVALGQAALSRARQLVAK